MAKIEFIPRNFSVASQDLLRKTDSIMEAYSADGYTLTLRQLYYQMIARDLFPDDWIDPATGTKNNIKNYKKYGDLVDNGRKAGWLDWDLIEDRGRETVFPPFWNNPADILRICARQFRIDKWENQPTHIEVMAEKDAVTGILQPVCAELQIRFTANRGYASSSLFYEIGTRLGRMSDCGKHIVIIYLGDLDPSGIDMTRDVTERMDLYTFHADIEVRRLALNMDQVQMWSPPENPAKDTDSRYAEYRDKYGESSWELDAIEPRTLGDLVREEVLLYRDEDLWEEAELKEQEMTERLKKVYNELKSEY